MDKKEVLSVVGGGGKTTTIFLLGEELKKAKKKILLTTTTAIYNPEKKYDYYFLNEIDDFNPKLGSITIFGEKVEGKKLIGPSLEKIEEVIQRDLFDYIIIEADGAKGKPIKAAADYEPVIPKSTTKTIGIVGLDCLGQRVESIVHRPEIFIQLTKTNYLETININTVIKYILNDKGLFKGACGERILLLNKANTKKMILKGLEIKEILSELGFGIKMLITDIKNKVFY